MTLPAGTRLGPYEIVAPIGSGGMGTVYRARDTRLGRTVALKTLHLDGAVTLTDRRRFEREGQAIAALSHPHICALFDVGVHEGTDYLVMECLEGETLASKLTQAIPLGQALEWGIQITDALAAAHERGIVHRDLKPANVMITRTGVRLLDFGLAGLSSGAAPAAGVTATQLTAGGVVVGTAPYMSPEQVEGRPASERSDIFAFGAVLYELITGRAAFGGDSFAAVMSAVLRDHPPPPSGVRPGTPAAIDRIVDACLAKDSAERWHCARDLRRELQWIALQLAAPGESAAAVGAWHGRAVPLLASAAAVALLAVAAVFWRAGDAAAPTPTARVFRLSVGPPAGTSLLVPAGPATTPQFEISPDGSSIAFVVAQKDGRQVLCVRRLEDGRTHVITGSEGAMFPFWAPDSRRLAFFTHREIKRVDTLDGQPAAILLPTDGRGGTWSDGDRIVVAAGREGRLIMFAAAGGEPTELARPSRQSLRFVWPAVLPGGRWLLFGQVDLTAPQQGTTVFVRSLDDGRTRELLRADGRALFAPPGDLLFVRGGVLYRQRFEPATAVLEGSPAKILDGVAAARPTGTLALSVSAFGDLAVAPPARVPQQRLTWFDRSGQVVGIVGTPGDLMSPSLSSDGRYVAVRRGAGAPTPGARSPRSDLWVIDVSRASERRVTFDDSHDSSPVWSPDGRHLAYTSMRSGLDDLFIKPMSGQGADRLLQAGPAIPSGWSPDGRQVVYQGGRLGGWQFDVDIVSATNPNEVRVVLDSPFIEMQARFSPDGRWLAYSSNESGTFEVYVQSLSPGGRREIVSIGGGSEPSWTRDGRELVYLAPDGTMKAVAVRTTPDFVADKPITLFRVDVPPLTLPYLSRYAVTLDGSRFLVLVPTETHAPPDIMVLVNRLHRN